MSTVSSMRTLDLRSDTVTKPTPAMRKAMFDAEVGDDVYHEDPTVNLLESMVAEMLGKEAAVLVSSGTMGNLVSLLSHCGRGDEMILGDQAHIYLFEQGGAAALGGIHPRVVRTQADGTLELSEVEQAIRTENEHYPVTRLICLENTHNRSGGRVLPVAYMDAAADLARRYGLALHVDGARLWNAAVALNVSPARLVAGADSVTVCLSKGLGGPVGSVIAGSKTFIQKARRNRKILGGSMRQAGIIAAAGIVAITEMVERLVDDHSNAKQFAKGLAQLDGIEIDPAGIETNLVFFALTRRDMTPIELSAKLRQRGVLINPVGGNRLRAVLNYHITGEDVAHILAVFQDALAQGAGAPVDKVTVYG
jgi:threonine aldolase